MKTFIVFVIGILGIQSASARALYRDDACRSKVLTAVKFLCALETNHRPEEIGEMNVDETKSGYTVSVNTGENYPNYCDYELIVKPFCEISAIKTLAIL